MIILGTSYNFTDLEKQRLAKKFKHFEHVSYENKNSKETIKKLLALLSLGDYEIILLNTMEKLPSELIKFLTNLQFEKKVNFYNLENFLEIYLQKCYIPDALGGQENIRFLSNIKAFNPWQYFQKRCVDYVACIFLLLIQALLLPLIRVKIKKQSPGNLFFKQSRLGINNQEFTCVKFRTMHENSYHDPYTKKGDTRVYPLGEFMRKTRIDEIPQAINILKNEMHLIGPRAEWSILVKDYEDEIPYYNERHLVRPGITGWAQVMYPYGSNINDARQKLMYDLYYIKHWSLMLEFKIIFKTIGVVLGKKGL